VCSFSHSVEDTYTHTRECVEQTAEGFTHSLPGVADTEDGSLEDLPALDLRAGHWTSGTRGGELG